MHAPALFAPVSVPFARAERASRRSSGRETMSGMTPAPPTLGDGAPGRSAIERAGQGDERAFAEFYDEVSPVVFGTTLRVLRNRAMAEEVTQEVFLELWRQAPRYDRSKGSPKAWACTIAHRRAVDRVRSEESSRARDEADANQTRADHDVVVDEVTTNVERDTVVDALSRLSDAQREAVSLAFYGGHTYREVAAMLNVPEGTIKTRIRDGLIRLRDLMGVTP
jgi:RNA polymerase sigma-70 factor, ECF subfamily